MHNPTLAQLVERLTVEVVEIKMSLVRFREVGSFFLLRIFFFGLEVLLKRNESSSQKESERKAGRDSPPWTVLR